MIIDVFNPMWIMLFVVDIVAIVLLGVFLRRKPEEKRCSIQFWVAVANLAFWFVYKVFLAITPTFDFVFLKELPLHLCNINSMLLIYALKKKKDWMLGFCYCFGTLGAILSILTPDPDFVNISLFSAKGCYYVYHHVLLIECLALVSTGTYKPEYKHLGKMMVSILAIYLVMHVFNTIMRALTHIDVNYFYSYGMEGNPIIGVLYRLIPIYPVYFLPMLVPLALVSFLMMFLARLGSRKEAA